MIMHKKTHKSVVAPHTLPKSVAVKKQARPRAAESQSKVASSVKKMNDELCAAQDVINEMTAEKEAQSKKEEEKLNSVEIAEDTAGNRDRFSYEPYVDGARSSLTLYFAMSIFMGCMCFYPRWVRFIFVLPSLALCYFIRRWIRNFYLDDVALKWFAAELNKRVYRSSFTDRLDEVANRCFVSPVCRLVGSSFVSAIHRFSAGLVCFEDGLPFYRAVVCVHKSSGLHPVVTEDERMSNQLANKSINVRVPMRIFESVNLTTGLESCILVVDGMVDQVSTRLRLLSLSDRVLQAESMASKVTNYMISGKWFPSAARGSARMARIRALDQDAEDAAYLPASVQRLAWASVFWWFVAFVILPNVVFSLPGDLLSWRSFFMIVIVGPVVEELGKSAVSRFTGVSKMHVSMLFGLFECMWRNGEVGSIPALLLHVVLGHMSTPQAIFVHVGFNGACMAMVWGLTAWLAKHAAPVVIALPNPYDCYFCGENPSWFSDKVLHPECMRCSLSQVKQERTSFEWERTPTPGFLPAALIPVALFSMMGLLQHASRFRRLFAVGYRVSEVVLPPVGPHGAKITLFPKFFDTCVRRSFSNTLGFALKFIAPCFPDFSHGPSALKGCLMRFCRNPPSVSKSTLKRITRFVRKYVRSHYTPIASDADVSFENWLDHTNYTEARKVELRRVWYAQPCIVRKDLQVDGFIKKESYEGYKPPRGINSRSDRFKCATGPFFKLIEEEVYHQPCFDGVNITHDPAMMGPFIKHIPVHLRPSFIQTYLGSYPGRYYETDYSQFEKHFTPEVMMAIEMVLYKHMLKNFPAAYKLIESTMCGTNKCVYNTFRIKIKGRRMSGEMCTSLGNGFSNLMLFNYVAHSKGGTACGIVEGDDALFYSSVELNANDFKNLGFDIKILVHSDLTRTAFCGMMMSRSLSLLRNPAKVLLKFGWTFSPFRNSGEKVRMGLLKAKALALAYECPRCPILSALAKRVLFVLADVKARPDNNFWDVQTFNWATEFSAQTQVQLALGPSDEDRLDFMDIFGVTVDVQREIESRIATWDGNPLYDPLIDSLFDHQDCRQFWSMYVADTESFAMGSVGDL